MNPLIKALTSVKFAIVILAVLIFLAIAGTILPDGGIVYNSAIFLGLIALLAAQIVACTFTRTLPLWRNITHPLVEVSDDFIQRQLVSSSVDQASLDKIKKQFQRYRVTELDAAGTCYLFAQRGRIGRFGAQITHIGVLIILLGVVVGGLYGYTKVAFVPVGQSIEVSNFELKMNNFSVNYYENGLVREYKAYVTIQDADTLLNASITVNEPLTYNGVSFYLESYYSGVVVLRLRYDPGVPLIWIGAAFAFIGLMLSFYIPHKRIWIKKIGTSVLLGGTTNKSKTNFIKEFQSIVKNLETSAIKTKSNT